MAFQDGHKVEFSQPVRQIFLMLTVLTLVAIAGFFLFAEIETVFLANLYLNGVIVGVFFIGVLATFWQVRQLMTATRWLRDLEAEFKGHEFTTPPRLLAAIAPLVREGRLKKRMAASSTRSILDSIGARIDEARDITRYITQLLIFLGLLGTFWGLSITVPAVVDTIRSLAPQDGEVSDVSVFDRLMQGLEDQLGGMGTAFASSLLGLAGSLVVGLLELFASHGQNRFFRELEEWLSGFTRLGLVSEGEGPEGPLVALLERVDEGLERTTEFAARAESARIEAEQRLGRAADVVAEMASQIERERSMVTQLISEMRESRDMTAGRDHATLAVLKRIDSGQANLANSHQSVSQMLERVLDTRRGDPEVRSYMQSIDTRFRGLMTDVVNGRKESVQTLAEEIRALRSLIDERTRGGS
ncbi:MAG: biopolymer transporter ExbB [Pseudomonadota bacterium]